jgi:ABC-type sugar transport system ATPase subunit
MWLKPNVAGAVRDLSLVAPRGKILCIAGQIGSGANVVTRALAGLVPGATGRASVDGKPLQLGSVPHCVGRGVLFLSEDRAAEGIFHQRSVLENLLAGSFGAHTRLRMLDWLRLKRVGAGLAQRVAVDQRRLTAAAGKLSGGNQQKLLFGRAIERPQPACC